MLVLSQPIASILHQIRKTSPEKQKHPILEKFTLCVTLFTAVFLCRPDVSVITANPKTAGVARWNFLALWGHLMSKGDTAAHRFVADVSLPTYTTRESMDRKCLLFL